MGLGARAPGAARSREPKKTGARPGAPSLLELLVAGRSFLQGGAEMKIGKPQRIYTVEPVKGPVKRENPPPEPRERPSVPAVPETAPSR